MAELELSPNAHAFWADFLAMAGGDALARFYESFHFGDSEMLADELAALVTPSQARHGSLFVVLRGRRQAPAEAR